MTPSRWPGPCAPTSPWWARPARARGTPWPAASRWPWGVFIVSLSAAVSTNPAEIPRFVEALKQGADFAKGSRFMPGAGSSDISRLRQAGNYFLNKIVNLIYGTRYTDLCYGYNAFRRECLSVMDLEVGDDSTDLGAMRWGDGFEVETLINVRIAKAGLGVAEVPSL